MKAESVKIFTRRITSANKSEIIVIIYDIIEENLALAKKALAEGDRETYRNEIKQAISFVKELLVSLDMNYEVSKYLASLYIYVIRKLGDSFREVAKTDESKPVMENTQRVYAGITYGRGLDLDETLVAPAMESRGFRA